VQQKGGLKEYFEGFCDWIKIFQGVFRKHSVQLILGELLFVIHQESKIAYRHFVVKQAQVASKILQRYVT
jgi:hypothetical protein